MSIPQGTYGKRARPAAGNIPKATYGTRGRPPQPRGRIPAAAPGARARPAAPRSRGRGRGRALAEGFAFGRILPKGNVAGPTGHLLTAQLLTGAVIVAIRALGDYQLTDSGTARGTLNAPGNGGYGPFTVLAGLIGAFFGLSFLASAGGRKARTAVAFGFLIIVMLLIKSMNEIEIVAGFITADPASRTVTAADYSSSATQPWGAAAQVPDPTQAVDLTAAFSGASSSSSAFFGSPFDLSSSAGTTPAGGAASSAAGASSGATSSVALNPTSAFPTISPGGSITPGTS
ncbi:MAG TPA: hypothetical protein VGG50_11480 [Streptosporangiaceae bacterium]|jgi:hypothetical protein